MQDAQQALKIGSDPRMLPEYEALRSEINKLSHASRPEVDWARIHQLASQIFERHGVDLQTAIYFVLARSRLQGLKGFAEGCEFMANLIVSQWQSVWPPVHQERARVEMLDWFIARVSPIIREYQISHDDKRLVYRCERALQLISEKLHHSGLSRIPRVENLVHFIEGYTHLFDEAEVVIVSDEAGLSDDLQIPPMVFFHGEQGAQVAAGSESASGNTASSPVQGSILVGREPGTLRPTVLKIEAKHKRRPAWQWFGLGVLCCALPVLAGWGWQLSQQPASVQQQVEQAKRSAMIARLQLPAQPMPKGLDRDDIRQARILLGEQSLQDLAPTLIGDYQRRLAQLEQVSPLYWYGFGDELTNSMQRLYPETAQVQAMTRQWQDALLRQRGNAAQTGSAYLGVREGIDGLLGTLLELERQRKSVTISYLKSRLYEIQKDLLVEVPLDARLSEMETRGGQVPPAQLKSMEDELKSLTVRLYQLQQLAERQNDGVQPPG
ncbi:VasL domain-containing protein [Aeromonas rivuli]|uniref:VasL domain-containing protein n=1 Tax=Aeromonas rivuli TaxID=648794 RepID=UPI0005A6D8D1|nr:VasL domain-containing protein [Aeromonas rivuli]